MVRPAACFTLLFSSLSLAAIYESPVVVDDADDLRAAADRGEISDATLQTLLELMDDGVDLSNASREELYELPGVTYADVDAIIAYRKSEGHIDDPAALVGAGALSEEQLLQIAPYLIVSDGDGKLPIGGTYRLLGMTTVGDTIGPPAIGTLKLRGPFSLSGGVGLSLSRRRVGSPTYDPNRKTRDNGSTLGALSVTPSGYRVDVPKFFLQWRGSKLRVLAGTFRLGFAERATLDNTTRYTPNGVNPDMTFYINSYLSGSCRLSTGELSGTDVCPDDRYVTDDLRWRDAFRGLAFSAENLELGDTAHASFHGFASYQTRSIYQYELFDHRICPDPRADEDDDCKAPNVYVNTGDPAQPQAKLKFSTLPNLFDELAAGGHVGFSPISQLQLGVTGYGAIPRWHVPELQLDFQEYSRYPYGGAFGAIGFNTRVTLSAVNLHLEVARSFDRVINGGGGWAVVQRTVWGMKKRELEVTARLYDERFINPYARPVSSPDEVDGQRARDEAGLRLKYTDRSLGDFEIYSQLDSWVLPWDAKNLEGSISGTSTGYLAGTTNLNATLRGNYRGWSFFQPDIWFDYRNKDLTDRNKVADHPERGACYTSYDGRAPQLIEGEPQLCTGERYRGGVQLLFKPWGKKLELELTYLHDFVTDVKYPNSLAQDLRFTTELRSRPISDLLFRVRVRYLKYDLFSNNRLEESLWSFFEVNWLTFRAVHVTARYDLYLWLDKRQSTIDRVPNPEHRLRLELEGRF